MCVCTVHGREPLPTLDSHEVEVVRRELCQIRDKVNAILDSLDGKSGDHSLATAVGGKSPQQAMSAAAQLEATSTTSTGGSDTT